MVRKPAVAGQFYSGSESALLKEVGSLIDKDATKVDAIGVVSPHAGYMYSGLVAGSVLAAIKPRPTYIIMGPNHTGLGGRFSLAVDGLWKTPLGEVEIDAALTERLKKNSKDLVEDELAHKFEHSIEVQLPFLQVLQKDFKIVPIVISCADLESYRAIGAALAKSVKDLKMEKNVAIIASSDMTHYEPQDTAKEKDRKAIDAILAMDEERLVRAVERENITMCGYAPTAIMLSSAKELGARSGRLIKYMTSGDVSGDYSSVVGYAGVLIV